MNLLTKQLIISLLIGFVPFCALTALFASHIDEAARQERALSTYNNLQSVAGVLENMIINFEEMSQYIIGNDAIGDFLRLPSTVTLSMYNSVYAKAQSALFLLPFSAKSYLGASVFRMDGRSVSSGTMRIASINEDERAKARSLRGNWFWSTEGGALAICRLIRDKRDLSSHLGYVKTNIDPAVLLSNFSKSSYWNHEYYAVLSADGEMLFSSLPAEDVWLLESDVFSSAVDGMNARTDRTASHGKLTYHVMAWDLEGKQTTVVCFLQQDRQGYALLRSGFLIWGVVLAVVVFFLQIFFTNRWMIKPLSKLKQLMQAIEAEDYSVRFNIRGRDEISVVAAEFNRMSDRLQMLYNQIYQTNLRAKDAEILALQAEINPHFLFNTLDVIYWMVNMGNAQEAMSMIKALSDSFHITLYKTRDGLISLDMAVEHLLNYLYIQSMRMKNSLRHTLEVQEGLGELVVLNLVLQPLVENAIVHGIAPRGGGEIIITIAVQGELLIYSVYDNGVGADPDAIDRALREPPQGKHGLALHNINERIKLKFGDQYGLTFHQPADGGSVFIVTQPVLRGEEDATC